METQVRFGFLQRMVIALTVLFIFGGLLLPKQLVEIHLSVFGVALILAGVPHGASDFFLYRHLSKFNGRSIGISSFFGRYVLLMAAYLLVWWLSPILAFLLFLVISAYHFGQSNWPHVQFPNQFSGKFTMLLWGTAVIGVPILLHSEQASTIVLEMTGWAPLLSENSRGGIIFLLVFGTLANTIQLYHQGSLTVAQFRTEIRNFFLLMLLFFTTPLLVGFGVYFVLWHSLSSMSHQVQVVQSTQSGLGIRQYLRSTVPLSLLAFAGLGLLYFFFGNSFDRGQNMGTLFLFISVITVPHAVLMEWLYEVGSPVLTDVHGVDGKTGKCEMMQSAGAV